MNQKIIFNIHMRLHKLSWTNFLFKCWTLLYFFVRRRRRRSTLHWNLCLHGRWIENWLRILIILLLMRIDLKLLLKVLWGRITLWRRNSLSIVIALASIAIIPSNSVDERHDIRLFTTHYSKIYRWYFHLTNLNLSAINKCNLPHY